MSAGSGRNAAGVARIWSTGCVGKGEADEDDPAPMFGSSFFGSDGDAE